MTTPIFHMGMATSNDVTTVFGNGNRKWVWLEMEQGGWACHTTRFTSDRASDFFASGPRCIQREGASEGKHKGVGRMAEMIQVTKSLEFN